MSVSINRRHNQDNRHAAIRQYGFLPRSMPPKILLAFAFLFSSLFIAVSVQMHGVFATAAYDIGIFDQAFWQYSKLLPTFNTVRGLNILGDHFSPIAFVFAPLYRVWPDISWALALQTASVAAGGVVLYLIARHLLPTRPWIALAVACSYYLHPAVHNTLLWQYHELVLASGLYLALIWSYLKDRFRLFVVLLLLLLACREDMPFTLAAFGVLAVIEKRWRFALAAIALSAIWWVVVAQIAFPYFNEQGYYRHSHGVLAELFRNFFNPDFYIRRISDPQSLHYLWQILLPAGLIGLFSPRYLLPALPTIAANVLIGNYNTNIAFHYSVSIMPFLYWAALATMQRFESVPLLKQKVNLGVGMAVLLPCASLWSSTQDSVMKLNQLPAMYTSWRDAAPKRAMLAELHEKFGADGVAASDFLLPHLSHRENIYLFPNPWKQHYWGVTQSAQNHHPNQVSHIVISTDAMREYTKLYDYLIESGTFEKVTEAHGIIVLNRLKPEAADRAEAIANFQNFSQVPAPAFTRISLSPVFDTPESEFRRLDVDLAKLQKSASSNAAFIPDLTPGSILELDLSGGAASEFKTRYVRAELHAKEAVKAQLDLGSDDGVTVWLNQNLIHENIVLRKANVEDDHVFFTLKPGKNVIVFRVNNATGGWRLAARVRANRCTEECLRSAGL